MHREYHPDDMRHRRAHAFDPPDSAHDHDHDHGHHHDHEDHEHRSLFAMAAVLGLLIGADLIFWWVGLDAWRSPGGVSLIWVAAILGSARMVYGALGALLSGRIGADFALAQASLAALVLREPFVAAEVVFIAVVGEVLEAVTADRAMAAIGRLFEQTPRTARVVRDGVERELPLREVEAGDLVVVGPGERVSVDGPVVAGRSSVDQSPLTGESIPADKGPGDPVFTGTINQFGRLEVRAERIGHESTLGQVLKLVADAQARKAPLERAADRYARYFLPLVELAAGGTILAGWMLGWPDTWRRAVAILVVACPCALVLATPAAVLASLAWLARRGVIVKGGAALERLARCDSVAFDKTGTLTKGRPELVSVASIGPGRGAAEVLGLAAAAERSSRHPLALALADAALARGVAVPDASEIEALPGVGVSARVGERAVLVGNRRLMAERGVATGSAEADLEALEARGETPVLLAVEGVVVGLLGLLDPIRPEAHDAVRDLRRLGLREVVVLTGDRASAAGAVARKAHIDRVEADLLPADKADRIGRLQDQGRRVAMVGDGINDAPALARADVGIAVGGPGADLAAEAGDIILLREPLSVLPDLVRLSRATVRVIRQNILIFAFGLNTVAIGAAALGVLGPVPAAILHQAGSLLVLLNAMRLLAFGQLSGPAIGRHLARGRGWLEHWDDRIEIDRLFDGITRRRWGLFKLGIIAAFLFSLTTGLTAIGPGEVGLVSRQGRLVEQLGPGLHLRWPWPIESVRRVEPRPRPMGRSRVSVGRGRAGDRLVEPARPRFWRGRTGESDRRDRRG